MNASKRKCPEYGGVPFYTTIVSSAGGDGPVLLPGLYSFPRKAKSEVPICGRRGLTRYVLKGMPGKTFSQQSRESCESVRSLYEGN
jgi:hypothetical protein